MTNTGVEKAGGTRIQAVENAFKIIDTVQELRSIGVTALANELDIPKSTAYVYLDTLCELGVLTKADSEYRLSLRFLEWGGYERRQMRLFQTARPQVDQIASETGEIGNLAVEEDGMRVLLYTSEPIDGVFDNSPTGQYTRMHWTALGKALLSTKSDDRVEEIIDRHGLPGATETTITERDVLFEELETIRERGYSIENEERREGIKAIGMPVFRNDDKHRDAAISVSGPRGRIEDNRDDIITTLDNAANVIELEEKHYR